jgi:hypothetical protein
MQYTRMLMAASGFIACGATLWVAGCGSVGENCTNGECKDGGGGGGVVIPACMGNPTTDPKLINDDCGLFVRGDPADDDGANAGTRSRPYKTLQAALNTVTDKWIFVCAKNPFNEKVTITKDNVAIYGGFDCESGWAWKQDAKSTIQGLPDVIAMTVKGKGVKVEHLKIQAAKATMGGGSSIAVLVDHADPAFNRSDLIAEQAHAGTEGAPANPLVAPAGIAGKSGEKACSKDTVAGAPQVTSMCSATDVSVGGGGGDGTAFNGNPGASGQPSYGGGQPGQGEPSNNPSWSCGTNNGNGHDGLPGNSGKDGSGATGELKLGSVNVDGFVPASGDDGQPGQPGQGGGGGGGVKGGAACVAATKGGASGGSGGTGGCGGAGGKGGQGAGASIALVSLESPGITLKAVSLTAAEGVNGGAGWDAQAGGPGTTGGVGGSNLGIFGLKDGCSGGAGGRGGDGGPGGGGRGGHSIGIAFTGKSPVIDLKSITVGKAGQGGPGGNGNQKGNKGADGVALPSQQFTLAVP